MPTPEGQKAYFEVTWVTWISGVCMFQLLPIFSKDKAEVGSRPGPQRRGGDRLGINIRLTAADEGQRQRLDSLRREANIGLRKNTWTVTLK